MMWLAQPDFSAAFAVGGGAAAAAVAPLRRPAMASCDAPLLPIAPAASDSLERTASATPSRDGGGVLAMISRLLQRVAPGEASTVADADGAAAAVSGRKRGRPEMGASAASAPMALQDASEAALQPPPSKIRRGSGATTLTALPKACDGEATQVKAAPSVAERFDIITATSSRATAIAKHQAPLGAGAASTGMAGMLGMPAAAGGAVAPGARPKPAVAPASAPPALRAAQAVHGSSSISAPLPCAGAFAQASPARLHAGSDAPSMPSVHSRIITPIIRSTVLRPASACENVTPARMNGPRGAMKAPGTV